jgi:hypothetical protein
VPRRTFGHTFILAPDHRTRPAFASTDVIQARRPGGEHFGGRRTGGRRSRSSVVASAAGSGVRV